MTRSIFLVFRQNLADAEVFLIGLIEDCFRFNVIAYSPRVGARGSG